MYTIRSRVPSIIPVMARTLIKLCLHITVRIFFFPSLWVQLEFIYVSVPAPRLLSTSPSLKLLSKATNLNICGGVIASVVDSL